MSKKTKPMLTVEGGNDSWHKAIKEGKTTVADVWHRNEVADEIVAAVNFCREHNIDPTNPNWLKDHDAGLCRKQRELCAAVVLDASEVLTGGMSSQGKALLAVEVSKAAAPAPTEPTP